MSIRVLVRKVRWIESDGCLRADEEIVTAVMQALGFKRRGSNIVATIQAALLYSRQRSRRSSLNPMAWCTLPTFNDESSP